MYLKENLVMRPINISFVLHLLISIQCNILEKISCLQHLYRRVINTLLMTVQEFYAYCINTCLNDDISFWS